MAFVVKTNAMRFFCFVFLTQSACDLGLHCREVIQGQSSGGKFATQSAGYRQSEQARGAFAPAVPLAEKDEVHSSGPSSPSTEGVSPMKQFASSVKKFLVSEDGPTAVEYAVMLALIVIVCLTAIQAIGTNASAKFQASADALK